MKRGGKEDFTWVSFSLSFPNFSGEFPLSFLNCSSIFHIMAADVDLG